MLRWLIHEFNLPEDLRIELVDQIDGNETLGRVIERNGRLVVQLSKRMCRTVNEMVETTMHEAAHAKLFHEGLGHLHGPVFRRVHGEMLDAFEHHGALESRAFPVD